jgi:octaprenyl-diphosphate synthase
MHSAKKILHNELSIFEKKFDDALRSDTRLLDWIMKYLVKRKGKQLRPMFVFLCAKLHGEVNESTYRAATLVELLHTATLVHDDVVDDASTRRGFFSINYLWKKKVAVLVGDYLLAKGLLLATDHKEYEHLHILSVAVRQMSEGELLQIEKSRKLNLSEEIYFEIIRKITASLLASSCAVGAFSTTSNHELTEQMRLFGETAGFAFQIYDDLFDYGNTNVGKPTGNDIQEKKLTVPLIHTLQHVDKTVAKQVKYILKNKHKDTASVNFVIDTVKSTGSIEYAEKKMIAYRDQSLQLLHHFPKSAVRDALEDLVHYLTDRTY